MNHFLHDFFHLHKKTIRIHKLSVYISPKSNNMHNPFDEKKNEKNDLHPRARTNPHPSTCTTPLMSEDDDFGQGAGKL